MGRKLASIVRVSKVSPIEGADRLEVAEMEGKGWRVVTAKGEVKPGDVCCYFEIDSLLDPEDERFAFLKDRCLCKFASKSGTVLRAGIRIKTIRLRGQISQGLIMPVSKFPEITAHIVDGDSFAQEGQGASTVPLIGADVTGILKVEHYDEVKEMLAPALKCGSSSCEALGRFPSAYIPKTDEERIQNLGDWFDRFKDMEWEATAKDDGSSTTMFYSPTIDEGLPFGVCSRNQRLREDGKDGAPVGYKMAYKYGVMEKLKAHYDETGHEIALQGELVGPGINSDRDKYQTYEWHVFKVFDITEQKYLLPGERRALCEKLGIPHVQLVSPAVKIFSECPTMDSVLKYAEGKTARGNEREGVVFKSLTVHDLSFKAVSNRYLLKSDS